jgi:hypothetical protein
MSSPRRNRVDPFGAIVAVADYGDLMGNRGCLHDDSGTVVRTHSSYKGWVACATSWKGVKRTLMAPGAYTELFFRDEATGLAAGHRPCFECRRPRAVAFREAWERAHPGLAGNVSVIDPILHRERIGGLRQSYRVGDPLPNGAMIGAADGSAAWLRWRGRFWRWSFAGYEPISEISDSDLVMLTIPSILAVFENGYVPEVHASAEN